MNRIDDRMHPDPEICPPGLESKSVIVRIPTRSTETLRKLAAQLGITMTDWIKMTIEREAKRLSSLESIPHPEVTPSPTNTEKSVWENAVDYYLNLDEIARKEWLDGLDSETAACIRQMLAKS